VCCVAVAARHCHHHFVKADSGSSARSDNNLSRTAACRTFRPGGRVPLTATLHSATMGPEARQTHPLALVDVSLLNDNRGSPCSTARHDRDPVAAAGCTVTRTELVVGAAADIPLQYFPPAQPRDPAESSRPQSSRSFSLRSRRLVAWSHTSCEETTRRVWKHPRLIEAWMFHVAKDRRPKSASSSIANSMPLFGCLLADWGGQPASTFTWFEPHGTPSEC
jgi:hypothetical protein